MTRLARLTSRWALVAGLLACGGVGFPAAGAEIDQILDGFDDEPSESSGADDVDDALGGFDDDPGDTANLPAAAPRIRADRFWELTGSTSLGGSVNYLAHHSDTGTNYRGLSRLRTRINLQLDLDLPGTWKGRLAGFGFYDWAYLANGRHEYTRQVLDVYEWDADFQEVWVQGNVARDVDLKIGRQIVNWGRSDTLRVIDILNPLDNREPGLTDIEDLRRPVMMVKADLYFGDWSLSLIAIPEIRFSKNPPIGSDFTPSSSSIGEFETSVVRERIPDESVDNTSWAAALTGIFSGWDVSLHVARTWADRAYLRGRFDPLGLLSAQPASAFAGTELRHSRITMVGSGANYALGSWLVKAEIAWLDGLDYAVSTPFRVPAPIQIQVDVPTGSVRKSRLDAMGGVEYYGFSDTMIALEVANRHIFGFRGDMRPNFGVEENALETALRVTRTFWNERLEATLVGIAFGNHGQDGSVVRIEGRYDLRDALVAGGGILLFQHGDPPPFDSIARNDRLFFEIKYSF